MVQDDEKRAREKGARPFAKPYQPPVLVRLGQMAEVTEKSGPGSDSSMTWPTDRQ